MTLLRLLPPVAWTAVVAWFSGESWGASGTRPILSIVSALLPWATPELLQSIHWLVRKGAHVTEYAVLASLWRWALAPRFTPAWPAALGLAALTAALDELHQSTTATRTGSVFDVALDIAAAALALATLAAGWGLLDRLIGALLWAAASGGTALIALNLAAAVPSGWLWLSAPAAWIALALRRRSGDRA